MHKGAEKQTSIFSNKSERSDCNKNYADRQTLRMEILGHIDIIKLSAEIFKLSGFVVITSDIYTLVCE